MIRRLSLTILVGLLASSCGSAALPSPDAGPRVIAFDRDSMTPKNGTCIEPAGLPDCSVLRLTAGAVLDDDVEETLYARWFVDGNLFDQQLLAPTQPLSARRVGSIFSFLPQKSAAGVHVAKVVVSNGFATGGDDFTRVAEGKTSAEWAWCVDTSKCANAAGADP